MPSNDLLLNKSLQKALSIVGYRGTDVGDIEGKKIYTNQEIRSHFIDVLKSQDLLKPYLGNIIRLVETGRIVPVHISEGILGKIQNIFLKSRERHSYSKHALGFFNFSTLKIYILVENIETSKNYWKKESAVSSILLHEIQHMTSRLMPNSFVKIHSNSLTKYYSRFIKEYFLVKNIPKDKIIYLYKWLHAVSEKGKKIPTDALLKYYNLLYKILKPIHPSEERLKQDLKEYVLTLKLYFSSPSTFIKLLYSKEPKAFRLFSALRRSYKSLNILKTDSLCIQEAFYPGEVICIESEYNTKPRHFALISKIK